MREPLEGSADRQDGRENDADSARDSARIEALLALWAQANTAPPDLADRIFEASRRSIASRRATRPTLGERFGELLSLFSPPRLALAAILIAALAVPTVLLLDAPTASISGGLAVATEFPPAIEATLLAESPVAEPLLVAMLEPVPADWSDVLGHEPGVELLSVIETRGRGLDEYTAEFEAIFGAIESAPRGM
jgi:hypothetical protein